jgi:uncharacterized membrane protein
MCRTAAPSARQLVARSVAVTRRDVFIVTLAPNGAKVVWRVPVGVLLAAVAPAAVRRIPDNKSPVTITRPSTPRYR